MGAFAGNPNKECKDVLTEADHLQCYRGVTWAKNVGIETKPDWYTGYNLTSSSSRLDIQCALSDMVGPSNGSKGHNCPVPCNSTMPLCAGATPVEDDKDLTTPAPGTTTTGSSGSSSFPWWAWLLIALGLAACLGGLAWYFLAGPGAAKSGAKKKKRGATKTKKETPEPTKAAEPAEAAPLVAPAVYVAPPIYTAAQPMQAMAQPMVQYVAQPMQYATTASAAPIQSISTMATAMPMAMPIQQATTVYQQGSSVSMPALA